MCGSGNIPLLELLLRAGADPNHAQSSGWTPISSAVNQQIVSRLVAAGAKLDPQDFEGDTPCGDFAYLGRYYPLEWLLAAGARTDIFNMWCVHTSLCMWLCICDGWGGGVHAGSSRFKSDQLLKLWLYCHDVASRNSWQADTLI